MTRQLESPVFEEAEQMLLGAIFNDSRVYPDVALKVPTAHYFGSVRHGTIYDAIGETFQRHGAADVPTVATVLRERNLIEDVGGASYLHGLRDQVMSSVVWVHAAKGVVEGYRRRSVFDACQAAIYRVTKTEDSIDETIADLGVALANAQTAGDAAKIITIGDAAKLVQEDIDSCKPALYRTGLDAFDTMIGGIPQDGIVTVMGIPSSGKSSLAAQIALNVAKDGVPVMFCSFEVGAKQSTANLLAVETELMVNERLRLGTPFKTIEERQRFDEAVELMGSVPIEFVEEPLTAEQIADRVALATARGVRVVVVDYIQGLACKEGDKESDMIARSCRTLQRMQVRHRLCVVMVSQLLAEASRRNEMPKMTEGVGSGAIAQVSTMMMGVWRPGLGKPTDPDETHEQQQWRMREAYIGVLKNKRGPLGTVPVQFRGEWMKFRSQA